MLHLRLPARLAAGAAGRGFGGRERMKQRVALYKGTHRGIGKRAIAAGGAGVCMGRQVFGAKDPATCIRQLREIIHGA